MSRELNDIEGRPIPLADDTQREQAWKRFDEGAVLDSLLPRKLEGGFEVTHIGAFCSRCHQPCTVTRGTITHAYAWMLEAIGIGYCKPCRFLTPIQVRFQHRKGAVASMSWINGDRWRQAPMSDLSERFWPRVLAVPREALKSIRRWRMHRSR